MNEPLVPSEAVDDDLGLLQAHAGQFPAALDGMDLLAARD
jgi:hypothetical protein